MNTCKAPLKLTWNGEMYKVNKPNDHSGEYVDKALADRLLESLVEILEITDKKHDAWERAKLVISKAEDE